MINVGGSAVHHNLMNNSMPYAAGISDFSDNRGSVYSS